MGFGAEPPPMTGWVPRAQAGLLGQWWQALSQGSASGARAATVEPALAAVWAAYCLLPCTCCASSGMCPVCVSLLVVAGRASAARMQHKHVCYTTTAQLATQRTQWLDGACMASSGQSPFDTCSDTTACCACCRYCGSHLVIHLSQGCDVPPTHPPTTHLSDPRRAPAAAQSSPCCPPLP